MLTMSAIEPLGEFEHIVLLSILRLGDEAYAVTIGEEILDRLETKGYLRSWLGDPTPARGGRAKRFYALRPRAVAALKDNRRALVSLWKGLESELA